MFVANDSPNAPGPRGRGRLATLAVSLAAAAVSLVSSAVVAHAWNERPYVDRETRVFQGPLAVSVRVSGSTAPLFQASNRPDRWYLEAREGGKYEIVVRNTTGERLAFVIAVDGLNAINGLRSHLGADEPMYVLDPWQSTTVKGWRKDLGNVSRFIFVDEKRSYAARTDQANGDLGWIRVAAFNEFRPIVYEDRARERTGSRRQANGMETKASDGPPAAAAPESSPGTGWGKNERDRVRQVEFTPEHIACTQVILRYEYRQALVTLGILPRHKPVPDRLWQRENGELGFAQPPSR